MTCVLLITLTKLPRARGVRAQRGRWCVVMSYFRGSSIRRRPSNLNGLPRGGDGGCGGGDGGGLMACGERGGDGGDEHLSVLKSLPQVVYVTRTRGRRPVAGNPVLCVVLRSPANAAMGGLLPENENPVPRPSRPSAAYWEILPGTRSLAKQLDAAFAAMSPACMRRVKAFAMRAVSRWQAAGGNHRRKRRRMVGMRRETAAQASGAR